MASSLEETFMYLPVETPAVLQGACHSKLKAFSILLGYLKSKSQDILILLAFSYILCKYFLKTS